MIDTTFLQSDLKKNIEDIKLATARPLQLETKKVNRSYKSIKDLINVKKQNLQVPVTNHQRLQNQREFELYLQRRGVDLENVQKSIIGEKYFLDTQLEESKNAFSSVFSVNRLSGKNLDEYLTKCQDYFLYSQVFAVNRNIKHTGSNQLQFPSTLQQSSYQSGTNLIMNPSKKKCQNTQNELHKKKLLDNLIKRKRNYKLQQNGESLDDKGPIFSKNQNIIYGNPTQKTPNTQKSQEFAQAILNFMNHKSLHFKEQQNKMQLEDQQILGTGIPQQTTSELLEKLSIISQELQYQNNNQQNGKNANQQGWLNNNNKNINNLNDKGSNAVSARIFGIFSQVLKHYDMMKRQIQIRDENYSEKNGINQISKEFLMKFQNQQQQMDALKQEEGKVSKLIQYMIDQSAEILEQQFSMAYEKELNVQNISNFLKSYYGKYQKQQIYQSFKESWWVGGRDSNNCGRIYVWGLLYCWYRAQDYQRIEEFLENNRNLPNLDYFREQLLPIIKGERLLTSDLRKQIAGELNKPVPMQSQYGQINLDDSYDPFKKQLYYLIAKWEKFENELIIEDDDDYLWLQLKMCRIPGIEDEEYDDQPALFGGQQQNKQENWDINSLILEDIQSSVVDSYENSHENIDKFILSLNFFKVFEILKKAQHQGIIDLEDLGHYILICKEAGFFRYSFMYNSPQDLPSQNNIINNNNNNKRDMSKTQQFEEQKCYQLSNTLDQFLFQKFSTMGVFIGIVYSCMAYGHDEEILAKNVAQFIVQTQKVEEYYDLIQSDAQNIELFKFLDKNTTAQVILDQIEKECNQKDIYKLLMIKLMLQNNHFDNLFQFLQKIFCGQIVKDGRHYMDSKEKDDIVNFCFTNIFSNYFLNQFSQNMTQKQKDMFSVARFLFDLDQFMYSKEGDQYKWNLIVSMENQLNINRAEQKLDLYNKMQKYNVLTPFFIFFLEYGSFVNQYQKNIKKSLQMVDQVQLQDKLRDMLNHYSSVKNYFELVLSEKAMEIQGTLYAKYTKTINDHFLEITQNVQILDI